MCALFTENGVSMFLWIGHTVDPELIQQLFGVASAAQVDIDKVDHPELIQTSKYLACNSIDSLK